ncbi:MAG: bifunctional 4-hydroxy-2-oxoglutarate aldolase/2-dehydro-3-deoxy-phosphogluconate aldolase [Bacteroidetes bacterium]|nr:bifunctional 4-hydroxy-2-oxoglutarate aldolase/2-dehydro-3-deoxy-phosphogluconate aldolase [Bacteroidota bacterium]MBS1974900.1 bifunctional 4-hydroxy-2-oxoglutarate aldolase/2-dehydro-3-deoxy-phosphogluconate aldolase [Bacteroidota bacterium]
MLSEHANQELIKQHKLLPLFYHNDLQVCISVAKALYEGGARLLELTNRGNHALANFKALVKERDKNMKDLLLCAGTIKTPEHAMKFIAAGADVLLSPVFDSSVNDVAYMQKILWIPGCMTPTEIHQAEKAGCNLIKLFPGNLLKPSFIEAAKPLFPNVNFIVTGGVDTSKENISSWFKAGASAIGIGNKLITNEILKNGDYKLIASATKSVVRIINDLHL